MIFTGFSPLEWGAQRVDAPPVQLLGLAAVFAGMIRVFRVHILATLAAILAAVLLHWRHLPVHISGRSGLRGHDGRDHQRHHINSPEFE
jgi:hypothetical protein